MILHSRLYPCTIYYVSTSGFMREIFFVSYSLIFELLYNDSHMARGHLVHVCLYSFLIAYFSCFSRKNFVILTISKEEEQNSF
jgi:hypothetical protein